MATETAPPPSRPTGAPPAFHLLAKPSGSTCNIDCTYCFFLSKEALYPERQAPDVGGDARGYIRQLLESHRTPEVTVAWQGGEPTLMRLEFFSRAVELVEKYRQPGQMVQHTFQTNGLLLDDEWCAFFKKHDFLVGPERRRTARAARHLPARPSRAGHVRPRHARMAASATRTGRIQHPLHGQRREPDARTRRSIASSATSSARDGCSSSRSSSGRRAETLAIANQGWSDSRGGKRLLYTQTGDLVTDRSVGGEQYGRFLIDIFEEWVRQDVGKVFVQLFDVTLEAYFGRHLLCIHAPTCGYGPALEHNGDLYTCDHFVEPGYMLGNIHKTPHVDARGLAAAAQVRRRQARHADEQCRSCEVRFCATAAVRRTVSRSRSDGEPGHNYLCRRARAVLHPHPTADGGDGAAVEAGPCARRRDAMVKNEDAKRDPYRPCPCGSGRKFRFCHGDKAPSGHLAPLAGRGLG